MSTQRIIVGLAFLFMTRGGVQAQTTVEGLIDEDTVWKVEDSPYIVTDTLYVGNDATLTIEAGVEVQAYPGVHVIVGAPEWGVGTLLAQGTSLDSVRFTAYQQGETGR